MAPLRWGTGDYLGAVSGEDGRQQVRDAVRSRHREEEFILTPQKRPGPPLCAGSRDEAEGPLLARAGGAQPLR